MTRVLDVPTRLTIFADFFRDLKARKLGPTVEEMGYLVEQLNACAAEVRAMDLLNEHLLKEQATAETTPPTPNLAQPRPQLFSVIEGGRA